MTVKERNGSKGSRGVQEEDQEKVFTQEEALSVLQEWIRYNARLEEKDQHKSPYSRVYNRDALNAVGISEEYCEGVRFIGEAEDCCSEINSCLQGCAYWEEIVKTIILVAYTEVSNPYSVVPLLAEDRSFDPLLRDATRTYLQQTEPQQWSVPFLEILAHVGDSDLWCYWGSEGFEGVANGDTQKDVEERENLRRKLKLLIDGPISPTAHSRQLYEMLYYWFHKACRLTGMLTPIGNEQDPAQVAGIMQGMIAQAKKGVYIWDFESFLPK